MKNMKLNYLATFMTAIVLLAGCGGLKKMKETTGTLKPTVTPEVLEMRGGKVEMSIQGRFPEKYFNKKSVLEVTPVIKYASGETKYTSKTYQGEGVDGSNEVIKYKEGGNLNISGVVDYNQDMMMSDLELRFKATVKDKSVDFPSIPLAKGVISTSLLVSKSPKTILLADNFQRITSDSYNAQILYQINQSNVRPTEMKKDEIKGMQDYVKNVTGAKNKQLKGITISAYASPDGPEKLNSNLAESRKKSANTFLSSEFKKAKVKNLKLDSLISALSTPEDWDGFKKAVEASNIQDKDLILRVLSMYSDPVVREKEIKNMAKTYEVLAEQILPTLRRSKMTVNVDVVGKSDEELKNIASSTPDSLNEEELLYAAKMIDDLNVKGNVYSVAANKYNSYRGFNNLGCILLAQNKVAEAKTALEKSMSLKATDAAKNNLGAVAMMEGDLTKAEENFTAAMASGEAASYNLGIIKIVQGDYDAANRYFGNINDVNAGLARLLSKQYDAATNVLNACGDIALAYYLKAVIGARTQNTEMLYNNLRTALGKDAKLKDWAKKDAEFVKYASDATLTSIIQ